MMKEKESPDKVRCNPEGFTCYHCKRFFKWNKNNLSSQSLQYSGHIHNCPENPDVITRRLFKKEGRIYMSGKTRICRWCHGKGYRAFKGLQWFCHMCKGTGKTKEQIIDVDVFLHKREGYK